MADQLKLLISADLNKAYSELETFKKKVNGTQLKVGNKSQVSGVRGEIDKTTNSVNALSGGLLDNVAKFSKWYIIGTLVSKVSLAISDLATNVISTDASLTTMAFTIDKTSEELSAVADATIQFAQELGSTGKMALEATKIFTNMNSSIEEILASSKDSVILSNLANLDIETSSDALQSLKNQFQLTDEEASKLVDTLTFVSSNLKLDFSRGIKEISSGISNSGQTAREAGLSVEQYTALLGKSVELSRRSGSSLSSGMRTIISRIRRVKELSEEEISDLEASYNSIGLTIRKSETEFKDFGTILTELSAKSRELTGENKETTLSLIAEQSAGIRQADTFRTMLAVWDDANALATESANNIGFATQKNELFIESIAGQKNILISTYEEFSRGILSPDFFKGFYSGATNFVNSLINIQESVGLVNAGLLLLIPTLVSLKGALIADKIFGFAGALLSLNPIVLGITAVVGTYVALASSYNATQKEMTENLNESTKALSENNKEFLKTQDNIDRFEELGNKTNRTTSESQEFNNIQESLNNIMPEVKDKIDAQNLSLEEQINLYQKLNQEARDKALEEAEDNLDKFGDRLQTNVVIIAKNESKIRELKKELVNYRDEIKNLDKSTLEYGERQKFLSGLVDGLKDSIEELKLESKTLESQNNNIRKSEELLAVAKSETILAVDSQISSYKKEIGTLENLGSKSKEELNRMLVNEKEHTARVLAEISKRINARIMELSPLEGTAGAEYIQFAKGMSDPVIKGLMQRKNEIEQISQETRDAIGESGRGSTGGYNPPSKPDKDKTTYLSQQEQSLSRINRELQILEAQQKVGTATEDQVISKLKEKQKALNALADLYRSQQKSLKTNSDDLDKNKDSVASLSAEWLTIQDTINGFIKENKDLDYALSDVNRRLEILNSTSEIYGKNESLINQTLSEKRDILNKVLEGYQSQIKLTTKNTEEYETLKNSIQGVLKELISMDVEAKNALEETKKLAEEEAKTYDDIQSRIEKSIKERYKRESDARKENLKSQSDDLDKQLKSSKDKYDSFNESLEKDDINKQLAELTKERLMQSVIGETDSNERIYQIDEEYRKLTKQLQEKERREKYDNEVKQLEKEKESIKDKIDAEENSLKRRLDSLEAFNESKLVLENSSIQNIIDMLKRYDSEFARDGKTKGEEWMEAFRNQVGNAMGFASNKSSSKSDSNKPISSTPNTTASNTPKVELKTWVNDDGVTMIEARHKPTGGSGAISLKTYENNKDLFEPLGTGGIIKTDGLIMGHANEPVLDPARVERLNNSLNISGGGTLSGARNLMNHIDGKNVPTINNNNNSSSGNIEVRVDIGNVSVANNMDARKLGENIGNSITQKVKSDLYGKGMFK